MNHDPVRQPGAHSRRQWLTSTAAAFAGSLASGSWGQQAPTGEDKAPPAPKLGMPLDIPDVPLLDGRVFHPSEATGQVLVVYWWASWCPFCAQQSPLMEKLWLAQRGHGLRMLGLSIDRKVEDATGYMSKHSFTFPAGLLTPAVARILPKPKGLPVTVVRGRDGRVLASEVGQLFPEDIEQFARFL
jgi:thiol-disulfide isomerase/thioredoxin